MNAHKKLTAGLAAASCTLLGTGPKNSVSAENDWDVASSAFFYLEEDDRVNDVSAKAIMKREWDEDNSVTVNAQIDTLSGASPNGATSSDQVQTFSRPSGDGQYKVDPGDIPLDDTFRDTRAALSGSWQKQQNRQLTTSLGASISKEYDYLHLGVNGSVAREINNRNTTLNAGIALSMDEYSPVGGTPAPLTEMTFSGSEEEEEDEEEFELGAGDDINPTPDTQKLITDVIVGVAQVINRRSIAQLNYSFSHTDGYMNDPYKLLSVVDSSSGELLRSTELDGGRYVYEKRPDRRTSHNIFAKLKYHFEKDILDISYRYHTDDWDINSHTVDFRYRYRLSGDRYLEPHLRYYQQSAAKFHQFFLTETDTPEYASADYRLAEFSATTVGLKFGMELENDKSFSARLEYYQASGDDSPDEAIGVLREQDLYPEVSAWILQANYSFRF